MLEIVKCLGNIGTGLHSIRKSSRYWIPCCASGRFSRQRKHLRLLIIAGSTSAPVLMMRFGLNCTFTVHPLQIISRIRINSSEAYPSAICCQVDCCCAKSSEHNFGNSAFWYAELKQENTFGVIQSAFAKEKSPFCYLSPVRILPTGTNPMKWSTVVLSIMNGAFSTTSYPIFFITCNRRFIFDHRIDPNFIKSQWFSSLCPRFH